MPMMGRSWLPSICVCLFLLVFGVAQGSRHSSGAILSSFELSRYIAEMEGMADFFWQHRSNANVDALFGLRLTQAHLNVLLQVHSVEVHYPSLYRRLFKVAVMVNGTLRSGVRSMHARNSKYSRSLGWVASVEWYAAPLNEPLPPATPMSERVLGHFSESVSDACIANVLGTGRTKRRCTISPSCWKMEFDAFAVSTGYTLTHSSLYYYMAKRRGCTREVESKLETARDVAGKSYKSISAILAKVCANIYVEMQDSTDNLPIAPGSDQDLFLEQGSLCAIYGYPQFLRQDWVNLGASWLGPNNCVPDVRRGRRDVPDPSQDNGDSKWTSRRLLVDVSAGGCSTHSTTLDLSYITAFVRYELELAVAHRLAIKQHSGYKSLYSLLKHGRWHVRTLRNLLNNVKAMLQYH